MSELEIDTSHNCCANNNVTYIIIFYTNPQVLSTELDFSILHKHVSFYNKIYFV